jgi:hypothetical protein
LLKDSFRHSNIRESTLTLSNNIYDKSIDNFPSLQKVRKPNITFAMSLLLENLLYRRNNKDNNYVLISLDASLYSPSKKDIISFKQMYGVSLKDIKDAKDILVHVGIIKFTKGSARFQENLCLPSKYQWVKTQSQLSKIELNDIRKWNRSLLELTYLDIAKVLSYHNPNIEKHHAVIRFKDSKDKKKIIKEFNIHKEYETGVQQINEYLIANDLAEFTYQRIYSDRISKDGSLDEYGYGRCFGGFQQITKEHRHLVCEELNLKEYDVTSCLPNILYCLDTDKTYEGDIYNDAMKAAGVKEEHFVDYREVFKPTFIIMMNCKGKHKTIQAIRSYLYEKGLLKTDSELKDKKIAKNFIDNELEYRYVFDPIEFVETIYNTFPEFQKYFFTRSSKLSQFIESQIAIDIMLMMKEEGINPLTIHDAYLFPEEKYEELSEKAKNIFNNRISEYKKNISSSFKKNIVNPSFSFVNSYYYIHCLFFYDNSFLISYNLLSFLINYNSFLISYNLLSFLINYNSFLISYNLLFLNRQALNKILYLLYTKLKSILKLEYTFFDKNVFGFT